MQKPSIGRIVIVGTDANSNNGSDICPAIITKVFAESPDGTWMVNAVAINDGFTTAWKTSIRLYPTEQDARAHGITAACFWPAKV